MTHCCSQCDFTAHFESALAMHRQLHHGKDDAINLKDNTVFDKEKSKPFSYDLTSSSAFSLHKNAKGLRLPGRTSSATRLFDKLKARICRSKIMTTHHEESADSTFHDLTANDTSVDVISDCTSKALGAEGSRTCAIGSLETKETFSCHLCNFDADRITVLDRHLLNNHKIGLDNLLKLVMAKTKEGLTESARPVAFSIRQPYYQSSVDVMQEEEFVIETVEPKIKVLKHAATNTDIQWPNSDIPAFKDNCQMITKELETLMKQSPEKCDKNAFIEKMQILNECMCKFVDSSNSLKKTLTKEFSSKHSVRERASLDQPFFHLCLGEESPRDWERAHSEKMERSRSKYGDNYRDEKKMVAESYYF